MDEALKAALAANLRRHRVAHRLSLSQLAGATGVSKATLSGMERANANPTVETLAAVATALRTSVGELLAEPELAPIHIVRAGGRAAGDEVWRALETVAVAGDVEIRELSLPARGVEPLDARAAGSRAHVLVVTGKLIAGPVERVSELATGDYASFPADVPHQLEAAGRPARAVVVASTPR